MFLYSFIQKPFGINFSILLGAFNDQIIHKKKIMNFYLSVQIWNQFHTNPEFP